MTKKVEIHPCPKNDGICPYGADYYLNRLSFQNLLENVVNEETYIIQLENLLNGLSESVK